MNGACSPPVRRRGEWDWSRPYFGAILIAPSSRIAVPLSMSFSQMLRTSAAYSSGRPRREGLRVAA